ncbi:MAG: hypothetical protein WDW36_007534 [Sanguina aurantia]
MVSPRVPPRASSAHARLHQRRDGSNRPRQWCHHVCPRERRQHTRACTSVATVRTGLDNGVTTCAPESVVSTRAPAPASRRFEPASTMVSPRVPPRASSAHARLHQRRDGSNRPRQWCHHVCPESVVSTRAPAPASRRFEPASTMVSPRVPRERRQHTRACTSVATLRTGLDNGVTTCAPESVVSTRAPAPASRRFEPASTMVSPRVPRERRQHTRACTSVATVRTGLDNGVTTCAPRASSAHARLHQRRDGSNRPRQWCHHVCPESVVSTRAPAPASRRFEPASTMVSPRVPPRASSAHARLHQRRDGSNRPRQWCHHVCPRERRQHTRACTSVATVRTGLDNGVTTCAPESVVSTRAPAPASRRFEPASTMVSPRVPRERRQHTRACTSVATVRTCLDNGVTTCAPESVVSTRAPAPASRRFEPASTMVSPRVPPRASSAHARLHQRRDGSNLPRQWCHHVCPRERRQHTRACTSVATVRTGLDNGVTTCAPESVVSTRAPAPASRRFEPASTMVSPRVPPRASSAHARLHQRRDGSNRPRQWCHHVCPRERRQHTRACTSVATVRTGLDNGVTTCAPESVVSTRAPAPASRRFEPASTMVSPRVPPRASSAHARLHQRRDGSNRPRQWCHHVCPRERRQHTRACTSVATVRTGLDNGVTTCAPESVVSTRAPAPASRRFEPASTMVSPRVPPRASSAHARLHQRRDGSNRPRQWCHHVCPRERRQHTRACTSVATVRTGLDNGVTTCAPESVVSTRAPAPASRRFEPASTMVSPRVPRESVVSTRAPAPASRRFEPASTMVSPRVPPRASSAHARLHQRRDGSNRPRQWCHHVCPRERRQHTRACTSVATVRTGLDNGVTTCAPESVVSTRAPAPASRRFEPASTMVSPRVPPRASSAHARLHQRRDASNRPRQWCHHVCPRERRQHTRACTSVATVRTGLDNGVTTCAPESVVSTRAPAPASRRFEPASTMVSPRVPRERRQHTRACTSVATVRTGLDNGVTTCAPESVVSTRAPAPASRRFEPASTMVSPRVPPRASSAHARLHQRRDGSNRPRQWCHHVCPESVVSTRAPAPASRRFEPASTMVSPRVPPRASSAHARLHQRRDGSNRPRQWCHHVCPRERRQHTRACTSVATVRTGLDNGVTTCAPESVVSTRAPAPASRRFEPASTMVSPRVPPRASSAHARLHQRRDASNRPRQWCHHVCPRERRQHTRACTSVATVRTGLDNGVTTCAPESVVSTRAPAPASRRFEPASTMVSPRVPPRASSAHARLHQRRDGSNRPRQWCHHVCPRERRQHTRACTSVATVRTCLDNGVTTCAPRASSAHARLHQRRDGSNRPRQWCHHVCPESVVSTRARCTSVATVRTGLDNGVTTCAPESVVSTRAPAPASRRFEPASTMVSPRVPRERRQHTRACTSVATVRTCLDNGVTTCAPESVVSTRAPAPASRRFEPASTMVSPRVPRERRQHTRACTRVATVRTGLDNGVTTCAPESVVSTRAPAPASRRFEPASTMVSPRVPRERRQHTRACTSVATVRTGLDNGVTTCAPESVVSTRAPAPASRRFEPASTMVSPRVPPRASSAHARLHQRRDASNRPRQWCHHVCPESVVSTRAPAPASRRFEPASTMVSPRVPRERRQHTRACTSVATVRTGLDNGVTTCAPESVVSTRAPAPASRRFEPASTMVSPRVPRERRQHTRACTSVATVRTGLDNGVTTCAPESVVSTRAPAPASRRFEPASTMVSPRVPRERRQHTRACTSVATVRTGLDNGVTTCAPESVVSTRAPAPASRRFEPASTMVSPRVPPRASSAHARLHQRRDGSNRPRQWCHHVCPRERRQHTRACTSVATVRTGLDNGVTTCAPESVVSTRAPAPASRRFEPASTMVSPRVPRERRQHTRACTSVATLRTGLDNGVTTCAPESVVSTRAPAPASRRFEPASTMVSPRVPPRASSAHARLHQRRDGSNRPRQWCHHVCPRERRQHTRACTSVATVRTGLDNGVTTCAPESVVSTRAPAPASRRFEPALVKVSPFGIGAVTPHARLHQADLTTAVLPPLALHHCCHSSH